MTETELSEAFRQAVVAHDRAKRATLDAEKAWDEARENEGVARRAESKAKRLLLQEARGVSPLRREKAS